VDKTIQTTIKTGSIVTGGASGIYSLPLFHDPAYLTLAIVGAIVSMFGVLHEIFGEHAKEYGFYEAMAEVFKGLLLGIVAIPFWYLSITEGGGELIFRLTSFKVGSVSSSLALIISFVLAWYTVPIFNWIVAKIKRSAK